MPTISRFHGISILMYYNDHPEPHFHAKTGSVEAVVSIRNPAVREGSLPARSESFVIEWARLHEDELMNNWELARARQPLLQIPPLE